jgi:hypothetical protein
VWRAGNGSGVMASKIGKLVSAPIFQHFPIDFVKLGAPTWADMARDDGV